MSFARNFTIKFSSFKFDSELDKYLFNASNAILQTRYNEVPGLEVENEYEKNIENPGPHFFLSKEGLQYPLSIFDRHDSRLWNYIIDAQDFCCSVPTNYKKICQAIQEKLRY